MVKLAILASGSGSNAESIIQYFQNNEAISVACIGSNKKKAYVLERAKHHNIPRFHFYNSDLREDKGFLEGLRNYNIDYIILAGFLSMIPPYLIQAYPNRILNIHPSLLPKFGGKGMYGMHVHNAVKQAGEKESGMSIHLVNEAYDKGRILFQDRIQVSLEDKPEDIASKVLALEHRHYPLVIEEYILSNT